MTFLDKLKEINKEFELTEEESLEIYNLAVQDVVDDEDGALVYDLIDALNGKITLDETGYHIEFEKEVRYYKDNICFRDLFTDSDIWSIEELESLLNELFLNYYRRRAESF